MKRITLLLLFIGIFISNIFGAYLKDVPMTLIQPNGDTLKCLASGDEFYHWLHDEKGFIIIQDVNTGYFVYSKLVNDELLPTEYVAGTIDPASVGLLPNQNISSKKYQELRKKMEVPTPDRKLQGNNRNKGVLNNLVVFIRFKDEPEIVNTFSSMQYIFNDSSTVNSNSMYNYIKQASYNQLYVTSSFYPAPEEEQVISYQDTLPRDYFRPYSAANPEGYINTEEYYDRAYREQALLKRAVEYVEDMIPENLNIDYNNDTLVDNICFVIEGQVGDWSDLLWPHRWYLSYEEAYIHGKRVWDFNFMLANARDYFTAAVLSHEMFHTLSYPDLYRYVDNSITPVGKWDVMSNTTNPGQQANVYTKWKYGNWVDDIPVLTESGEYTIFCNQKYRTQNIYKIPTSVPNEYIVMEYRKQEAPFDNGIYGSGIVFYRINDLYDGNANTTEETCDEVYAYRMRGTPDWDGSIGNAYFPKFNFQMTEFNAESDPYPFLCDGTPIPHFEVSDFSEAGGDSMTFYFNADYLAIDEYDLVTASVFPNPTNSIVTLQVVGEKMMQHLQEHTLSYHLLDMYGRKISHTPMYTQNATVSLQNEVPGLYFLQLMNGEQPLKTFKIVKQ